MGVAKPAVGEVMAGVVLVVDMGVAKPAVGEVMVVVVLVVDIGVAKPVVGEVKRQRQWEIVKRCKDLTLLRLLIGLSG